MHSDKLNDVIIIYQNDKKMYGIFFVLISIVLTMGSNTSSEKTDESGQSSDSQSKTTENESLKKSQDDESMRLKREEIEKLDSICKNKRVEFQFLQQNIDDAKRLHQYEKNKTVELQLDCKVLENTLKLKTEESNRLIKICDGKKSEIEQLNIKCQKEKYIYNQLQHDLCNAEAELKAKDKGLKELDDIHKKKSEEIANLQRKIYQLSNQEKNKIDLKRKNDEVEIKKKEELRELDEMCKNKKVEYQNLQHKINDMKRLHETERNQLEKLQSRNDDLKNAIKEKNESFQKLAKSFSEMKSKNEKHKANEQNKRDDKSEEMNKAKERKILDRFESKNIVKMILKNETQFTSNSKSILVLLDKNADEYKHVEAVFMTTTQKHFQVVSIWKVSNSHLMASYLLRKKAMMITHGEENIFEERLFRGIRVDHLKTVSENNFNLRLHTNYAGKYRGLSFTSVSNHANRDCDNTFEKCAVLAKVLICKHDKESVTVYKHPFCSHQTNITYDSKRRPNRFRIKYNSDEFYPEYIIHFTGFTLVNNNVKKI